MISRSNTLLKLTLIMVFSGLVNSRFDMNLKTSDKPSQNVVLFLNFNFPYILIQSENLKCDELESCKWINSDRQVAKYGGNDYEYTEAMVEFKFDLIDPTTSKVEGEQKVKVRVRITDHYNVLGMNIKTVFSNSLDSGLEFVIDLKKLAIMVQPIVTNNSK